MFVNSFQFKRYLLNNINMSEYLPWVEKYRPKKIDDIISHNQNIETIKKLLQNSSLPHLLFYGSSGTGKTSTILALSKEMLGYVRGKYSSIPIPNAEVNLNQGDLLSAATAEKNALIERLRAYFDETSRQSLLSRRASEAESKMIELQQVPYTIFIA